MSNSERLNLYDRGFMTIPFEDLKAEMLADPEVKTEYDKLADEFEAVARTLLAEGSKQTQDDVEEGSE
jgi:hypothetical protein